MSGSGSSIATVHGCKEQGWPWGWTLDNAFKVVALNKILPPLSLSESCLVSNAVCEWSWDHYRHLEQSKIVFFW
jgi:hypothetical protein